MNISRFFIQRPIFAAMLSALILLAGLLALPGLPISEYPEVVPPTIVVRATYPGANPTVIADTVASPLEQAINGVEDMLYQYSQATSDGVMTLTVTFKLGTDVDKAQVQVQNRVSQALPKLPPEVQRLGVVTNKSSPDITLAVFVYSPNGRYDQTYLANFVALRIKDELARLDGVGDVQRFGGGDYSMRVWLDPEKVAARGLTTGDVVSAIREQNVQVAAGQVGAPPAANGANSSSPSTPGPPERRNGLRGHHRKTGAAARSCACAMSRARRAGLGQLCAARDARQSNCRGHSDFSTTRKQRHRRVGCSTRQNGRAQEEFSRRHRLQRRL
jgi:multidrug efflux pump